MNRLHTYSVKPLETDGGYTCRVYWATGKHRRSALDIVVPRDCSDPQAAAEVTAIRYLLGHLNVFNEHRTGTNLILFVSLGVIRKIALKTTTKEDLYEYGYSLFTRYSDAKIEVSKDQSWLPETTELSQVPVVDASTLKGIETVPNTKMGEIAITRHALDRYQQCCNTVSISTAWKNLIRRLSHNELIEYELPDRVAKHKYRKYGDSPVIMKTYSDPIHYVFCRKDNMNTLVTVFSNHTLIEQPK